MAVRFGAAIALLALGACGPAEGRYEDKVVEALCEMYHRCGWVDEIESCLDLEAPDRSGCTYDRAAARACVRGIDAMTCAEDAELPEYPSACAHVYECPDDPGAADISAGRER